MKTEQRHHRFPSAGPKRSPVFAPGEKAEFRCGAFSAKPVESVMEEAVNTP